jgi:hypothetical protein
MSLSAQATERVFARLMGTYGRDFSARYEGSDANTVRSIWAHELEGFSHDLPSIAWALEHLPERPPNAIEFRNLCRHAPQAETPRLDAPKADQARVNAELAKLAPMLQPARDRMRKHEGRDYRAWARAIVQRKKAGDPITPTQYAMALEALKTWD